MLGYCFNLNGEIIMTIQSLLLLLPAIQVGIVVTAIAYIGYHLVSCTIARLTGKKCL